MIDLISKMVLCLLVALLLGFLIGWLLSKIIQAKKHIVTLDKLNNDLAEKDDQLIKLNREYGDNKAMLLTLTDTNKELNTLLEDKSKAFDERSLELTQVQQALHIAQNTVNENITAKEHNQALVQQVNNLEKLYAKKNVELKELEEVVVKAEDKVEETYRLCSDKEKQLKNQYSKDTEGLDKFKELKFSSVVKENGVKKLEAELEALSSKNNENKESIARYQKKISDLEEELKRNSIESEEDEFIISKDQFIHIENQLVQYQKEIDALKEENKILTSKSSEIEILKIKGETSELDDTSIVKLFRDTYKKITKP